jgi:hypothetical protein
MKAAARAMRLYQVTGNSRQFVEIDGVTFFVPISVPQKIPTAGQPAQPYVPTAYPADPSKANEAAKP